MNKTVKYNLNKDSILEVDYEDGKVISAVVDDIFLSKESLDNLFEALKETFGDFGRVYPPGVRGQEKVITGPYNGGIGIGKD